MLHTNVRHRTKFHRSRPNGVREKRYRFYTIHYFGALQVDLLGQSSPI